MIGCRGNLVRVAPFMGDPNDDALAHLAVYLQQSAMAQRLAEKT